MRSFSLSSRILATLLLVSFIISFIGNLVLFRKITNESKIDKVIETAKKVVSEADDKESKADTSEFLIRDCSFSSYSNIPTLYISFDKAIYVPAAPEQISIFPEVNNLQITSRSYYGSWWSISGDFDFETTYIVTIYPGFKNNQGDVFKEEVTFQIKSPARKPEVNFMTSGPYYPIKDITSKDVEITVPFSVAKHNKINFTIYKAFENTIPLKKQFYRWEDFLHKAKEFTLDTNSSDNNLKIFDLDLTEHLQGLGKGVYRIKAQGRSYYDDQIDIVLSEIGVNFSLDEKNRKCFVHCSSIVDGKAVKNAKILLISKKLQVIAEAESDQNGFAKLDFLPDFDLTQDSLETLLVKTDDDSTYLFLERGNRLDLSEFQNYGYVFTEGPKAFIFCERGVCRPGENMQVSFYLREHNDLDNKAISSPAIITVSSPDGKKIINKNLTSNEYGFATCSIEIPDNARTGKYTITCSIDEKNNWGRAYFDVATYVPDRIKVELKTDKDSVTLNEKVKWTAQAEYYFGQKVTEGKCNFMAYAVQALHPSHWDNFSVGDSAYFNSGFEYNKKNINLEDCVEQVFDGFEANGGQSCSPVNLVLNASVRENSGSTVTGRKIVLCHPSEYYLGVQYLKNEEKEQDQLNLLLKLLKWENEEVKLDNELTFNLECYELEWDYVKKTDGSGNTNYVWEQTRIPVKTISKIKMSEAEQIVELPRFYDGYFELIFTNENGLRTKANIWHWRGTGGKRSKNPNVLSFDLDQEVYKPGTTAQVTVNADADAILYIVSGEKELEQQFSHSIPAGSSQFRIDIPENINTSQYFVAVTMIYPGRDTKRLFGMLKLPIDQSRNKLNIELIAPERSSPKEEIKITVNIKDNEGKACAGQVQLFAVDEGILALTAFKTPNIFDFFHGKYYCNFEFYDIYSAIFPDIRIRGNQKPGSDISLQLRAKDLFGKIKAAEPAIIIAPEIKISELGSAEVSLKLPDHTGALRIMAVGVSESAVGSAEKNLIMRDLITVIAQAPRVLAPDDEFMLSISAFNNDSAEEDAELEIILPDSLTSQETLQYNFKLQKGAAKHLKISCLANKEFGSSDLVCNLKIGKTISTYSLAINVRPILPPISKTIAKQVLPGERLELELDKENWDGELAQSVLNVSAAPTAGVKDALNWLNSYPYGCLEQNCATAFPFLGLENLQKAKLLDSAVSASSLRKVERMMLKVISMMHSDGSFSIWPGSETTSVSTSIFAAHFLIGAERNLALNLDTEVKKVLIKSLENNLSPQNTSRWQKAYSCYVLSLTKRGSFVTTARDILNTKTDDFAAFMAAAALMQGSFAAEANEYFPALMQQEVWLSSEGIANEYIANSVCRKGVALSILMDLLPENEVCHKLAFDLHSAMATDSSGWGTTHNNAWITYGLAAYLAKHGSANIAAGQFQLNDEVMPKVFTVDKTSNFPIHNYEKITLSNTGDASYFVSLHLRGQPKNIEEKKGFLEISRQYLNSDGEKVEELNHGDLLTVKINIKTLKEVKDLVIIDLLPGGLEIEDESLKTRAFAPAKAGAKTNWRIWPDFIEKRDDRYLWFGKINTEGTYEITYQVRAVTQGKFAQAPLLLENMYDPTIQAVFVPENKLIVK